MSDNKKATKNENENLQKQLEEMEGNWKRALADYKNLQRRIEEEKAELVSFSNMVLLTRLLPIFDNLKLMEKHSNEDKQGLSLILKELDMVLKDAGVTEIDAQGKDFNPDEMDAAEKVEGEEGQVIEVLQAGYKLNDRLIRPARVTVGTKDAQSAQKK